MLLSLSVIVMTALTLSGTAHSTDLTVNFTANLRETTCDMKLVGGSGSNTEQTLKIGDSQGKIRLDRCRPVQRQLNSSWPSLNVRPR